MDYLKFEMLDFVQRGGRNSARLPKNVFTITSCGKHAVKSMFSRELTKEIEQFKFLLVKRNDITSQDYLIFNNDKGMRVSYSKADKRAAVSCKDFCSYLQNKYGKEERCFRMELSENKSNSPYYATYEIIGKAQK